MARLAYTLKNIHVKDLPNHQKMLLALQWLRSNPRESPTVAARLYFIKQEDSVRKAWLRARKKVPKVGGGERNLGGVGMNKILRPEQHQAMIRYVVDQATNGGATKQMLYNCPCGFAFKRISQFLYGDGFKLG
jgi:hypothetical protein